MRIGYICGTESWGGLEMNQAKNALWMHERGHHVSAFGRENSKFHQFCVEHELSFHILPPHRKYYDFKVSKQLRKLLNNLEIEHLILRDVKDMSVSVAAKFWGKSHFKVHYFMEMQLGVNKKNLLHTIRFRLLDTWSCPLEWLHAQVLEKTNMPSNRVVTIPSALDLRPFSSLPSMEEARKILALPLDATIIGLAGRFDPQKGQLLLLEAFRNVHRKDVHVLFLGEPTANEGARYFEEMQKIISENHWQERVHIRGFRKDIAVFYRAINAFVMASKAETVGMVTLEAMACGTIVIGSNAGGTTEILNNGKLGYLFESLNADSLTEQMDEFLQEPTKFPKDQLKKRIEKFDHHVVLEQVEQRLMECK